MDVTLMIVSLIEKIDAISRGQQSIYVAVHPSSDLLVIYFAVYPLIQWSIYQADLFHP